MLITATSIGGLIGAYFSASVTSNHASSRITTNQQFIEQIRSNGVQNPKDVMEVFRLVFGALPKEVKVYPTENYYYFRFYGNGGDIWGNIRLDSIDRENGIVSFAYFYVNPNRNEPYYGELPTYHRNLSEKDGVKLEKIDKLRYAVSFEGKRVEFQLNDLAQQLPKDFKLYDGEELAARLCDESGLQFFLIFNSRNHRLHYALDETIPLADILRPFGKNVFLGQLSEFAFYLDGDKNRKVLFGVNARSIERNSYYDGPFDQLADNFVDPIKFQAILEKAYPHFRGKVKGRGDFVLKTGERFGSRLSISPYISYQHIRDLWSHVAYCESQPLDSVTRLACIANERKMTFVPPARGITSKAN